MKKSLESVLEELKADYLISLGQKIERIDQHFKANNTQALRDEFHKLKGTGQTYGFPEITEIGRALEARCEQGDSTELSWLIPLALKVLSKIQQRSYAQSDSQVDDDVEFIKIRSFNS